MDHRDGWPQVWNIISDDEEPPNPNPPRPNPATAINYPRRATIISQDRPVPKKARLSDSVNTDPFDVHSLDPSFIDFLDLAEADIYSSPPQGLEQPSQPTDDTTVDEKQQGACLATILELFPDISHEHVRELFDSRKKEFVSFRRTKDELATFDPSQVIIEHLLDSGDYPKQKDKKRKRAPSPSDDENKRPKIVYPPLTSDEYQDSA